MPSAAAAHPTGPSHGGYVAAISGVAPPVLGVQVAVLGGDRRLSLTNTSEKTVVILNAAGCPFLRFADQAVHRYDAVAREWKRVASRTRTTGPSRASPGTTTRNRRPSPTRPRPK